MRWVDQYELRMSLLVTWFFPSFKCVFTFEIEETITAEASIKKDGTIWVLTLQDRLGSRYNKTLPEDLDLQLKYFECIPEENILAKQGLAVTSTKREKYDSDDID